MFKKKTHIHNIFFLGGESKSISCLQRRARAPVLFKGAAAWGRAQGDLQIGPAEKGTRPTLSASEVRAAVIPGDP